ncbi:calcium-binding protein [Mesorhizobium sp. IMUNJ 23232]|uniref:calcium-binding protein n=1 Tax=Mesorhizobium sp. IMUNJ 23232 TaxID=3376064 RepID=UPI0037993A7E
MPTPSFFGPEILVNTTISGFQGTPSIAGLAGGKFVAVWEDLSEPGGFLNIRVQLFNADGSKLGGEFVVNGNEVSAAGQPTVTALEDGRYVVAWTNASPTDAGDGSGSSVKARVFNADGSPAGNEFFLNSETRLDQTEISISALADGGFAASWSHDHGVGDLDIRGRVFNADGTPRTGAEFAIDGSIGLEVSSATAGLAGGGFVSVWVDSGGDGETDGSGSHIRAQRFDANGADVGDEFVVNSTTLNDQSEPTVTALANGGFAVAWTHRFDADDTDVILRIFNANGLPVTSDVFIDGDFNINENSVSMVGLPDGHLFVTWTDADSTGEGDGSLSHIRGQVISGGDGSALSGPFIINTTAPLEQLDPSVTVLADGRVAVSWMDGSQSSGATGFDVRAQIIDPRTAAVNLTGSDAVDDWDGTAFADTLNGKGGADRMAGAAGNDTYFVDNAKDVIVEAAGKGNDTVAANTSYVLAAGADVETLRTTSNGGTSAINLTGNDFAQTIIGNAGANVLKGGGGADTMQGLGGNDVYSVDNAKDVVIEGAGQGKDVVSASFSYTLGADAQIETLRTSSNAGTAAIDLTGNNFPQTVVGNAGANTLRGLGGNDDLQGLAGNDKLLGGDGDDDLFGGLGFDKMGGGGGKDEFVFSALAESGIGAAKADQITDFSAGDKIDVAAIDAIAGGSFNAFKLDAGGAFSAGEIRQTVSGGNLVLDFNVDADTAAEMSVVLIGQTAPLSVGDFVLLS